MGHRRTVGLLKSQLAIGLTNRDVDRTSGHVNVGVLISKLPKSLFRKCFGCSVTQEFVLQSGLFSDWIPI